jgi:hypothetical protein
MRNMALIFFLLLPSIVRADSAGPNSPDSVIDEGDWGQANSVLSSDDQRANHASTNQHWLRAYGFGFTVSGTIDSFVVEVEGYGPEPNSNRRDIEVALSKSSYTVEGATDWDYLPYTAAAEDYVVFNGNGLWGGTWSDSDVNSSAFGALVRDNDASGELLFVDHIRITVYYTPSGGGGGDNSYTRRRKLSVED